MRDLNTFDRTSESLCTLRRSDMVQYNYSMIKTQTYLATSLKTMSHLNASISPRPVHDSCSQAVSCRDRNEGYDEREEAY